MTAPRGAAAPSTLPPAGAHQDADNRAEQVLIHTLIDELVDGLTDRSGTTHEFPWNPEQHVRVGVLGVTVTPPAVAAPAGNGAGGAAGTPAAAGPGAAGHGGPTDGDPDDPDGDGGGTTGAGGPPPAPPVDNRGVLGLDFIVTGNITPLKLTVDVDYALYHQLNPDFAATKAEATGRAAAAAANPRRRPTVPINPSWVRDDRHVSVDITVGVGADETTVATPALPGGDPLAADAAAAVAAHYTNPAALWKLARNQTIPVAEAMGTQAEFEAALARRRDPTWAPATPEPRLTVTTVPTVDGHTAVSVSFTNALVLASRDLQDLSLYDAQMTVTVHGPAQLEPQTLGFADDDYRYTDAATVVGRGRGCVAEGVPDRPDQIAAQTLPLFSMPISRHRTPAGADLSFGTLAGKCLPTLDAISAAMRAFLAGWDTNKATGANGPAQNRQLHDEFEAETERFELGVSLLRADPDRLGRAFADANKAFAASRGATSTWHLFQLVFIVTELGALAGRENPADPRLRAELDSVDVLWYPTGGGKTEAYLGLATVAMFYDRLRGKHRGTTAWFLFPLRMLSVQQLARIAEIVHHAEAVRDADGIGGDPFTLGYLVGSSNTPNRLAGKERHGWWPGLAEFTKKPQTERDAHRLVGACPACRAKNSVGLDTDLAGQRLLHVCRTCGHVLAIHASDEEVSRYQPAIVVSTVDKICAFARNGELTSFNRGPRARCPQHGFYTHDSCVVPGCAAPGPHPAATGFKDPTPALWIQDELHLVREELGVFAAHYHTLLAELARGAGHEPSKVIAATATIEQYEDQLSQVYGRRPRLFPTGGPALDDSFYNEVTNDVRRVYLGVLPAGGGTVKVDLTGQITAWIIGRIHTLADDPAPLIAAWAAAGITVAAAEARRRLFDYELALAYVNSKAHGVAVLDDLNRLSEDLINAGSDPVCAEYVMGETPLGELAKIVAAVQDSTPADPRGGRIRGLVGTSVVSHGVDLDRLNFEVLAGMPPTYAHYVQATARAGRSHVGLVISAFDRLNRRETSMYQSFLTTHAALDRMVEPVPVNRFASRAVERTLPGIVCALLWDETRDGPWATTDNIGMTRKFRPWWNTHAAALVPRLRDRIAEAYRCPVPDPAMHTDETRLIDAAVRRWEDVERLRMQAWQADWLTDLFTYPAMTSLRDVDPPVDFSAGNRAEQIVARIYG
ncbi:MAG TPA: DEAD/DEAH box helicase [Acidimicrobiales bacterium]|nr:DEAD/DEAH box helicase [Acidimicrobiales bacterium]